MDEYERGWKDGFTAGQTTSAKLATQAPQQVANAMPVPVEPPGGWDFPKGKKREPEDLERAKIKSATWTGDAGPGATDVIKGAAGVQQGPGGYLEAGPDVAASGSGQSAVAQANAAPPPMFPQIVIAPDGRPTLASQGLPAAAPPTAPVQMTAADMIKLRAYLQQQQTKR